VLQDKKILLIITGSIAAYKSATLIRLFVKSGASVKVVMTAAATEFITPLTLSTLSKNKVLIDMMAEGEWNSHVDLGLWADLVLVAPATANSMAKMASGQADNLAMTTYLSAKCPVAIAPAMDLDMWSHPTTKNNIKTLEAFGNSIIPVDSGELASGLSGEGRMAEPEKILEFVRELFSKKKNEDLKGKKILITAGPTYEAIDPVRFIGNHSSGKMGLAIARICVSRGAEVRLILGPSSLDIPEGIKLTRVTSAAEMADAVSLYQERTDIFILTAAVADYTPVSSSKTKLKKGDETFELSLKRTMDIARSVGKTKRAHQILIGFALETDNALENARKKLKTKNFDFIVLNSLEDKGAGFRHDTNKITIIGKDNKISNFELKSKDEVARDIVDHLGLIINSRPHQES
jgi:phosphopantothenoylcysteine decarboxylase/phosphopantothenate--cysteine ligase